jgi:hypothetical protein
MNSTLSLVAVGLGTVTVIDALGSFASKRIGFPYPRLAWLSFAVYVTLGFLAERSLSSAPLAIGLIVSAYDVSVGWWISWIIGPGRLPADQATPKGIALRMVLVVTLDVALVAIGAWTARTIL